MLKRDYLTGFFTLIGVAAMFLPAQIRTVNYYEIIEDADLEYISGIELEFPLAIPFPFVIISILLLLVLAKSRLPLVVAMILSTLNFGYLFIIFVAVVFDFMRSVKPGIGFYFMVVSNSALFILSIIYVARPKGLINNNDVDLLDDEL